MIAVLFVFMAVLAVSFGGKLTMPKVQFNPHASKHLMASGNGTSDTYLVSTQFVGNPSCTGDVTNVVGLAAGVCYHNSDGSSYQITNPTTDFRYTYYDYTGFASSDCTGASTSAKAKFSTDCNALSDSLSGKFNVAVGATPWAQFTSGLVVEYFFKSCSGSADQFIVLPFGQCTAASSDADAAVVAQTVDKCTDTTFTLSQYADAGCQKVLHTYTVPLNKCELDNGVMTTMACNKAK